MSKLLQLFTKSLTAPTVILSILLAWLDLINRASDIGIGAIDTELNEISAAQQARAAALESKSADLAAARTRRATAGATARVEDILADFK